MASLLDSVRRLGAVVGARRKRSRKTTRTTAVGRIHGARLQGLEALEERTLLSVGPAGDEGLLAHTTPTGPEPAPLSRLIVRFDEAVALESAGPIATDLGATLLRTLPSIYGAVIEVNTAGQDFRDAMSGAVATWAAHPGVRYAEADSVVHIDATIPNDPRFSELWGMNNTGLGGGVADADIDAPEAWDVFRGSDTVVVADIDTGVDYTHPDLAANMWRNPGEIPNNGIDDDRNGWIDDVYGIDAMNNDSDPMDDDGHGTHTSGTFGAVGNNGVGVTGVNWNVKIMALKFLGPLGGSTAGAITAIDYMTMMKTRYDVNIVASNNSWGGGGYSQALYDAIKASNDAGIMFVAAAGNGGYDGIGDDNDLMPSYPASYNLPGIIAVAATNRRDQLGSFSNYGRTSVDLGAPGVEILSTVPPNLYGGMAYDSWPGTSMATPHVTGAVALGMAYEPTAPLDYIKQLILSTVDVVPDLVNRTVTGGRLNLNRFITSFNQAPVLNVTGPMTLRTVRQEDVNNFGTRIAAMLESGGTDVITDPNFGAQEGVAVIAASTTQGTWQYTTNNGATWKALGNVSNASARLLAANTATRIRFLPKPGFVGLVSPAIMFRAWDQTSGANGGVANAATNGGRTAFSSATATATITVAPVNHAPVLDPRVLLSLRPIDQDVTDQANTGTLLRDILASGNTPAITDVNGNPQGIAVTGADQTRGFWQYWIDDVVGWQDLVDANAGTPSASQATLLPANATTKLRFVPNPGFYGTVTAGINFRAWDQTSGDAGDVVNTTESGGQTAFSRDVSSASITVRWINEAPVLVPGAALKMTSVNEDDVSNPGTLITGILASLSPAPFPITDSDADMSPGVGIAVTQADETFGGWWYTTNGRDWQPIAGAVSDGNALLLAADNATRLRFVPDQDFNTSDGFSIPMITFRAWDRTSGTNGGTANASINGNRTAFSTRTGMISILVNALNDPPRFVKGPDDAVLEDSPKRTVTAWATRAPQPADESLQTVWFDVVADKPALFAVQPAIDPSGVLTYTPAPDAFGMATVTVRARDDGGTANGGQDTSAAQTFTITVRGINDAPSFMAGPGQVADENAPRQVVPGWATEISCGPGESGQNVWFVVGGNSNPDLFAELPAISPEGTLTYRVAPNANGTARITVVLRDNGGTADFGIDASDSRTFAIDIIPLNAAPVALGQTLAVDAGQSIAIRLAGADGDPEVDQALTFTIFSQPTLGTITGFKPATGELVYTPRQNALGIDRFTFAVTDDETAGDPANRVSAPATVEVRVHPVVQAPVVGSGTNAMVLRRVGNNLRLELANAREPLFDQPLANVQKLTILGSPANADQLTVDFAAGGVFPLDGGLVFNGRSFGADALAVRGRSGADAFALQRGQLTANGVTVLFQNVAQVRLDGGAGNDSYTLAALDYPVRIVDSSGVDQLDFSPWIYGSGVNLNLARTKGEAQQVNILAATLALSGTFENVVGTPWNDTIRGNAAANRLWGGDGDDVLYGLGGNDFLHGGAGNDVLFAGTGADFLFGGLGNDALIASSGRAILVGGEGTDELQGSTGESIFIGGTTAYDNNNDALAAIMSEWGSSRSFTDRVNRLRTGVGPNRSVFLRLNESVFDDLLQDRMIGGKAKEWFLAFAASDLVENFGAGDIQSVVSAAKR